jgi:ribosomal protein S18 acetylase RimI-like enzyme
MPGLLGNAPAPLRFRNATAHDAAGLSRLYVDGWKQLLVEHRQRLIPGGTRPDSHERRWRSDLLNGASRVGAVFALAGDQAVGLCAWRPLADPDGAAELLGFHLQKPHRGRHEGRRLLDAAFTAMRSMGYSTAVLWMWAQAPEVRGYLERHGFRADAERHAIELGQPMHEIRFRRALLDGMQV